MLEAVSAGKKEANTGGLMFLEAQTAPSLEKSLINSLAAGRGTAAEGQLLRHLNEVSRCDRREVSISGGESGSNAARACTL